jgi:hypothetical protein
VPNVLDTLLAVLVAAVCATIVVEIIHRILTRLGRRSPLLADLARTAHRPFLAVVVAYAVQQAVRSSAGEFTGRGGLLHALVILVIAAAAWLVAALMLVIEDVSLA